MAIDVGVAAGLGTAASWSVCAQFFGAAGMRIGSVAVNHVRLLAALAVLVVLHALVLGTTWPSAIAPRDLALLAASGIVGLVLGDAAGFRALVLVGPGTATLMVTATPAVATLEAWVFLHERLPSRALAGVAVTVIGIVIAVWARAVRDPLRRGAASLPAPARGLLALGLLLAFCGAVGQATGQVLARPALRATDPLSATIVRIATATLVLWAALGLRCAWTRRAPRWWHSALGDRRALALTMGGVATGPTVGVWLSQVATRHAPVGVASTLMALVPILVMGEDWAMGRRRPNGLEVLGAVAAVSGVALLVSSPG